MSSNGIYKVVRVQLYYQLHVDLIVGPLARLAGTVYLASRAAAQRPQRRAGASVCAATLSTLTHHLHAPGYFIFDPR